MKLSHRLDLLSNAVSVACVVGIAATVAWAVWVFVQPPAPIAFGAGSVATPSSDSGQRDLALYLNTNPFGATRRSENDPVLLDTLEETRLDLVLIGCFPRFHDPSKSVAIISSNGRDSKSYKIGDILAGFAKLVAIHADSVELEQNGERKVLRFKRGQSLLTAAQGSLRNSRNRGLGTSVTFPVHIDDDFGALTVRAVTGDTTVVLSPSPSLREVAEQHRLMPKKHLREVSDRLPDLIEQGGLTPVSTDTASGYELTKASISPALFNLGLREGDVLLSVNGKALGSRESDQRVLDNAFTSHSARIKVKRGNRSFIITVPMK